MKLIDYQMGRHIKPAPLTREQKGVIALELISGMLLTIAMCGLLFMFAIMFERISA